MHNIKAKFLKHQKNIKIKTHVKDKEMIDKVMRVFQIELHENISVKSPYDKIVEFQTFKTHIDFF